MGVINTVREYKSSVPASRMFKAIVLDSHVIIPKLLPQSMKCIEIEGDGGVGSVRVSKFPEGSPFKYMKHRVEAIDSEKYYSKYTLFEGDIMGASLESLVQELQFTATDGGCICKSINTYYPKAGAELSQEEIKDGEEKSMGLYKVVEEYLLANPNSYV
uniref:Major allergen Pru ar 1-like n=1 Tax=Rhizophora mucronata TaxID=61149 RepID=A0A2P2Q9M5_RHIMU